MAIKILNEKKYNELLGISKPEVLQKLGWGLHNLYTDDLWIYELDKIWILREIILFIEFENNYVTRIDVKYFYFMHYNWIH